MHKPLSTAERADLIDVTMSRRDRLLRWAAIIHKSGQRFRIFHLLEQHYCKDDLKNCAHPDSAFAAAYADPILRDAGLTGESAADAMKFFELSQNDLHHFSCDCGGELTNEIMATRIIGIAERGVGSKAVISGGLRRFVFG